MFNFERNCYRSMLKVYLILGFELYEILMATFVDWDLLLQDISLEGRESI